MSGLIYVTSCFPKSERRNHWNRNLKYTSTRCTIYGYGLHNAAYLPLIKLDHVTFRPLSQPLPTSVVIVEIPIVVIHRRDVGLYGHW